MHFTWNGRDGGANFAIQQGVKASKSRVKVFKHNDMADLERMMLEHVGLEKKDPKRARHTRQFLIVEGLYVNHGDICPLKQLVCLSLGYPTYLFVITCLNH